MIDSVSAQAAAPSPTRASVKVLRALAVLLVAVCLLTFGLALAYFVLGGGPFAGIWEDAFMSVRYADNLLHGRGLIWNPGGQPVYGLTSIFYMGPVALMQALTPGRPVASLAMASFGCGLLFLVAAVFLLRPFFAVPGPARVIFGLILGVCLARGASALAVHFWSGMDTMFDLSMLTGYFLLARWREKAQTLGASLLLGAAGGLIYGVRPDLLIYTLLAPAAAALWERDAPRRRLGWIALAVTALTAASVMIAAYLYFGTALPLSFYAKGLRLYGDFEYEHYRTVPFEQLRFYVSSYFLLFAVIGLDLLDSLESRSRDWRSPLSISLLCGTALFIGYYLFFVLQIMEFSSRFYYPTLPALLWLAGSATERLTAKYGPGCVRFFRQGTGWGWVAAMVLAAMAFVTLPFVASARQVASVARRGLTHWDLFDEYRTFQHDYWFRLDRFSELPVETRMATTEIGHVAAMNPGKVVIDMAGLNEPRFARHPFSAQVLLSEFRPDLIFMPHPGYRGMNRDLLGNTLFQTEYDYFPATALGASMRMGLAIRRASPQYARMRQIVDGK